MVFLIFNETLLSGKDYFLSPVLCLGHSCLMFRRHAHIVFLIFNAGRGNSKGVEVIVAKNVFNVFYCEPKKR